MSKLAACDHLKALSIQLNGMGELFCILSEYEHPIRSDFYEFLSWTVERMGEECRNVANRILEEEP